MLSRASRLSEYRWLPATSSRFAWNGPFARRRCGGATFAGGRPYGLAFGWSSFWGGGYSHTILVNGFAGGRGLGRWQTLRDRFEILHLSPHVFRQLHQFR